MFVVYGSTTVENFCHIRASLACFALKLMVSDREARAKMAKHLEMFLKLMLECNFMLTQTRRLDCTQWFELQLVQLHPPKHQGTS